MHTCSSVATYFLYLLGFLCVTQADWLPFTQLSLNRDSITITNSGNLVFFAGGRSTYTFYGQVEVFDFSSQSWNYNPRLTVPRSSLTSTTLNNKVYFAGGQTDSGVSNIVDIYDLASEEWTTAKLNVARMEIAAASVGDLILFAGGRDLNSNSFDIVDIYNAKVFLSTILKSSIVLRRVYRTILGQQLLLPTKDMGWQLLLLDPGHILLEGIQLNAQT